METELTSIERLADEQHHSGEVVMLSESLDQQDTSSDKTSLNKSDMVSKSKKKHCSFIESPTIRICIFLLFTSLIIIVAVLTVYFTSLKQNTICQLTFKRTMKSSIISSSQPRAVAVGDLNNDHRMDIIVVNSGTNTIGIFVSKGNGTFASQKIYSTGSGSNPKAIAVSDFNNDTQLDIAVANYGTNNIGIFIGNENGTFIEQKVFSLGSSRPLFITVGDFNKDNRTDIVTANYGTDTISILFGYGNGSFQDQVTYFTGYDSILYSLAVDDFNNDDHLDIALANYGTDNIGIFYGYGDGKFSDQQIYTTLPNSNPSSIAVGDFNNDNQLDIVVTNNAIGNIGIFFGHINGTFLAQTIYAVGSNSYPQYITVGDMNKDNALDIIVVDSKNDQIHIIPGYGNGSFASITTYDTLSESNPIYVAIADFNNNNQSDIAVANYGTNNVLVLSDYSIKPSVRKKNYDTRSPSKTYSVAVSDFNNDHILDLVFTAGNNTSILIGSGNGTFDEKAMYSIAYGFYPRYVCVEDLNNDNQKDVVIVNTDADSIVVLLGLGNGTFDTMMTYSTGIGSNPRWIALADVNHDKRLDIVSANRQTDSIGIHLGYGDGTFATMITYSTGTRIAPNSVAIGNINNDNHVDIVVAGWYGSVVVFLGDGNGTFTIMTTYSTGGTIIMIALVDVNSDKYLDIVISNVNDGNIGVFLGYNNGTFASQITYSTGFASEPYYVIFADFNNDNISDFVTTNCNTDELALFYGYGNGSFQLKRKYSTGVGSKPYGITVADFHNNKQLEFVVALWGSGNVAVLTEYYAAEFASQTTYSTGFAPHPFSVVVGDFNNDSRSDIVIANSGTDNLGIFLGSGNGTLNIEMTYSIGTNFYPQYVITCDVDKDNQIDIVSVNSKNNSISFIMGNSNGTFKKQMIYSTGDNSYPYATVSGDFNNDGRLDFAVTNKGTNNIGFLFGFNYRSFQSQAIHADVNSLGSYGIVIHDLNNDNILDIATTFLDGNSLGVLLGYNNSSFMNMMIYSTGINSQPVGIAVGDFDNDSRVDIVVANHGSGSVGVLQGLGGGNFAAVVLYSMQDSSTPNTVAVGDLNNDARLDIIVANGVTDNIGVLMGHGNGSFAIVKLYSTGHGSNNLAAVIIDLNNDGNLDIAVANNGNNNAGVLLGNGDGTFKNLMTFSTGANSLPSWIVVADFNRDNRLDIATANLGTNNIGIFLAYDNGTFASVMTYSTGDGSSPQCIMVGDFNNDNQLDISAANYGTSTIVVLFGIGDGSFLLGTAYSTGTASAPYALAIGDFNNDTKTDIAVVNSQSNNIILFLGYASEPFAGVKTYTTGDKSQPHSIATADFNNDGRLDIVVANYGTDNIGILLGHNNGIFGTIITYSTGNGSAPYAVAIADFNHDNHTDIVVTNSETDNIAIFLGYGNGTFAMKVTYSTGTRSRPYGVATGDLNNDNILDIVVANSGTSNIFQLFGYSNGTFGNEISYALGYQYSPYSVAVGDLNQDNWMDIVIACYNTDHVETLIKMC